MKILNRFFFIPLLLIVFFILFYSVYQEVKNKTIDQFNSEQLVIANAASRGIEDYMTNFQSELKFLSGFQGIIDLNEQGKELLENYYNNSSNQIEAITRVDSQGIILATYPENRESLGKDISYQEHVRQIIESQKPIISDVFMAVQGYLAIAIHVPILKDNKYKGSLAILISIDKIGKRYLENIKIGKSGYAILLSENNIEIFSPFYENISKSIKEISQNDPSVDHLIEEIEKKDFGSVNCIHDRSETINHSEKHVVFSRIPMGNTYWTILISVPISEVYDTIIGFRNKLMLLFSLIFTFMIIYFYFFTKAKKILKEEAKRKIAEKKLIESEAYIRTLFNQSPIGLALTDMDGKLVDVNQAFASIIGKSINETLQLSYWDITPKKYQDQEQKQLDSLNSTGRYGPYEKEYIHKEGHLVPIRLQGLIIEKEGIPHIWSSVEDITESKQFEQRILESEEYFRTIFEQSASGMCITSIDGVFLQVNIPLCEMLSYTIEELNGKHFNDITFSEDKNIGAEAVKKMLAGKTKKAVFEKRYLNKSGKPIWVNINTALLHDKEGNPQYFITQIEDISQRKISDVKLISSENKFKALVEQSLTGIYIFEKEKFIYVNKRFCEIFGYSEEEILETLKPTDVINIEDRAKADENVDKRLSGQVESARYQARGNHKDGKELWIEIHGTQIMLDGKKVITGTILDITETKIAEEALSYHQELLNEMGALAKIGGWEFSVDTGEVTWTDEVALIHDLDPNDFSNVERALNFYQDESRLKIERALKEAIDLGKPYDLESEIKTAKGVHKWIHTIGNPIIENGKVIKIRGSFQDITERKKAKEELKNSELYFRHLFEANPQPMWVYDLETLRFLAVNEMAIARYGYTNEEFLSMTLDEIRPTEEIPKLHNNIKESTEDIQESGIWQHQYKDGTLIFVEIYSHKLKFEDKKARLVLANNVTERIIAEKEIKILNEELEQKVNERTKDLENKISEIERMNRLFIDRELRMKELKEKIRELEKKQKKLNK